MLDATLEAIEEQHPSIGLALHEVEPPHGLGPVARFDAAVDGAFDRFRGTEPADRILYALTELGDFGLIWLLLGFARGLRSDEDARAAWRLAAALGVESVVLNGVIKSRFKRERPVSQVERPHKMRIPLTTSFPSGHSSTAMVASLLLTQRTPRSLRPLYFGLAALVAASRIHVRIHHASDVVGGVAVGLALGTVARRVWPLYPDRPPRRRAGIGHPFVAFARNVTLSFSLTWDYRCPFARIAHRHVCDALLDGADWDVRFVPFCLGQVHVEEGEAPIWDHPEDDTGLLALQAAVVVRDARPDAFVRVHRALFEARHADGAQLRDPEVLAALLEAEGVDARTRPRRGRHRHAAEDRPRRAHRGRRRPRRVGRAHLHRRRPGGLRAADGAPHRRRRRPRHGRARGRHPHRLAGAQRVQAHLARPLRRTASDRTADRLRRRRRGPAVRPRPVTRACSVRPAGPDRPEPDAQFWARAESSWERAERTSRSRSDTSSVLTSSRWSISPRARSMIVRASPMASISRVSVMWCVSLSGPEAGPVLVSPGTSPAEARLSRRWVRVPGRERRPEPARSPGTSPW